MMMDNRKEMNDTDAVEIKETFVQNGENTIFVKYYLPVGRSSCPVIICSHGYNGSHGDWTDECTYFAGHGYVAVSFDFCGGSMTGRSSGKTTDMTISTEKADLSAVMEWVSGMACVDRQRIFLLGGSQGGLVTALAAEEQKEKIAGMILYFPGFCIPETLRANFCKMGHIPDSFNFWNFTMGRKYVEDIFCLSVYDIIGGFDKAVLIIHGAEDEIVPLEYSRKAVTYYQNARLVVLPDEKHGFTEEGSAKAQKLTLDFMEEA